MAYAVAQHNANSGAATIAYASAQTAGNTNMLGICYATGQTISGVSDSKNGAYTLAGGPYTSIDAGAQLAIYYRTNIATATAGSNTVTIAGVSAGNIYDLWAIEVSGLGSAPVVDGSPVTNQGASAPATFNITPSGADFIFVVTGITQGSTGTLTNLTLLDSVNDCDYYHTTATSGLITCSDSGLTEWGLLAVAFKPGASTVSLGSLTIGAALGVTTAKGSPRSTALLQAALGITTA